MLVKLTHPLDLSKQIADAINRANHKSIFSGRKPATRARGSRDLRPTVTRPAPDGR